MTTAFDKRSREGSVFAVSNSRILHYPMTIFQQNNLYFIVICFYHHRCGESALKEEIYHAFSLDIPTL